MNRALWLVLVACGAPTQPSPIANRPGPTRAVEPAPDVSSCRAVVAQQSAPPAPDPPPPGVVITATHGCGMALTPIVFAANSARVDGSSADPMAAMLACHAPGTKLRLELIGHASPDERDPERLALDRAHAVEQYFTACGVPALGFTATSVGAREPIEGEQARSRRVEFRILERSDREP